MTDVVTTDALVLARTAVHGFAEHVLAVAARQATRSIRLYVRDGALSTPDLAAGGRVRLVAGRVSRWPDGPDLPFAGRLGDLAEQLGVSFGLLDPPYPPASGVDGDYVVDVEAAAVELVLDAWRTGDAALRRFDARFDGPVDGRTDRQRTPIVWPEHLDVAISADAVNFGVSPGDAYEPRPYAYVGPHEPRTGDFWNAPFGAARRLADLGGIDEVLAFFRAGRDAAA